MDAGSRAVAVSSLRLSASGYRLYDELEEWAKGLDGVTAAYDGLEIEV